MTLIVSSVTEKYAVLAADRRLTSERGIEDEEQTKIFLFTTPNARVTFAFTGLARFEEFQTESWLFDAVGRSHCDGGRIDSIVQRFVSIANSEFSSKRFRSGTKPELSIILCGFEYFDERHQAITYRLSNFENGGSDGLFSVEKIICDSGECDIQLAGYQKGVDPTEIRKLRELSLAYKEFAIEMKAYDIILKASKSILSNNYIGSGANVSRIGPIKDTSLISTYYANIRKYTCYGPNVIMFGDLGPSFTSFGSILRVPNDKPPVVFPRTSSNAICPCGSGIKYKKCHARIKYPYMAMTTEFELIEGSYLSGKIFRTLGFGAYQ